MTNILIHKQYIIMRLHNQVDSTTVMVHDDYSHKIEVNETESGAESVSNYEYERREQDKKRQIKLLDPRYLPMFLEEFERLIRR